MGEYIIKNGNVWGHGTTDLRISGNKIVAIGSGLKPLRGKIRATTIIDASNKVIFPGLVNTHHHLTQSIAKGVPDGINSDLNEWLEVVPFELWPKISPDVFYASARLGFYELLRSGCTTCADHFYLYHQNFDMELEDVLYQAAKESGIRFVHCRGGATHVGSHVGAGSTTLRPESVELYLKRCDTTAAKHHIDGDDSMCKMALAPTSIVHTSPPEDLRQIARYGRYRNMRLHSHLLEVPYDNTAAKQHYSMDAIDYAENCHWLGEDVWFAHLVHADDKTINKLASTGTGIAHCPTSNNRLGSGIANIPAMFRAGMNISIGVDGSASAESGSMINELMQTWLLHRSIHGSHATTVEQVVKWGSQEGAKILGLSQAGAIAKNMCADFSIISLDDPRFWGVWEPTWSPVICGEPIKVEKMFVNGEIVVEDGVPCGIDLEKLRKDTAAALKKLRP